MALQVFTQCWLCCLSVRVSICMCVCVCVGVGVLLRSALERGPLIACHVRCMQLHWFCFRVVVLFVLFVTLLHPPD